MCLLALGAVERTADAQATPDTSVAWKRVVPGDTTLRPSLLRSDTLRYDITGYRDGAEIPIGLVTDVMVRDSSSGTLFKRVVSVRRGTAALIDSTNTDAFSLAPRWHRSVQPTRLMRLDINGRRVRGVLGPADGPGVAIDTTLSTPFFDSNNWDLIIRAMPLTPQYAAVFRVYDLDVGLMDYRVRVIGATEMLGEAAHVCIFQLGSTREVTVWIGKESRRLLQVETPLNETTFLRQSLRR
jgi:hypothetical protein